MRLINKNFIPNKFDDSINSQKLAFNSLSINNKTKHITQLILLTNKLIPIMKKASLIFLFIISIIPLKGISQECNTSETDSRRFQISEMNNPNSFIIQMTMKRGREFNGTAFFIHPRVLITAGHNLRKRPQFIFTRVKKLTLRYGATDENTNIHEEALFTTQNENIYTLKSFNRHYSVQKDYGIIILPNDSAYKKIGGKFKLTIYNNLKIKGKSINIAGYPGDKPFATQWQDSTINHFLKEGTLKYDFKTDHGLSGGPIWIKSSQNEYEVFAIHTNGRKKGCTTATIITNEIYNDILRFCLKKGINLKE